MFIGFFDFSEDRFALNINKLGVAFKDWTRVNQGCGKVVTLRVCAIGGVKFCLHVCVTACLRELALCKIESNAHSRFFRHHSYHNYIVA